MKFVIMCIITYNHTYLRKDMLKTLDKRCVVYLCLVVSLYTHNSLLTSWTIFSWNFVACCLLVFFSYFCWILQQQHKSFFFSFRLFIFSTFLLLLQNINYFNNDFFCEYIVIKSLWFLASFEDSILFGCGRKKWSIYWPKKSFLFEICYKLNERKIKKSWNLK